MSVLQVQEGTIRKYCLHYASCQGAVHMLVGRSKGQTYSKPFHTVVIFAMVTGYY